MNDLTPIPPGIVLCAGCGARLAAGGSLPGGATPLCAECAENRTATRRIVVTGPPAWVSIRENPVSRTPKIRPIWIPLAAATVIVVAGAVFLYPRHRAPLPQVAAAPPAPPPAPAPPLPVAEDSARKAVDPKKDAEAARLRRLAELQEELDAIDQETAGFEAFEEFNRVLELLGGSKERHGEEAWTAGIAQRMTAVRAKAEAQFAAIRGLAADAREAAEKAKLRERVGRWGLPGYFEELEKALGAVPPPPPAARSKEGQAYLEDWERAMARAAARDYDRALPELRRAAKQVREEELRREAASDLDDLEKVKLLWEEIGRLAQKVARGAPVTLQTATGKVSGVFVMSDGDRVEVRTAGAKETVFVELAEATAASLAGLVRGKVDGRTLALFCLIEGHPDGARAILGRLDDAPAKYWAWTGVGKARALPPEVDPEALRRERGARELYVAAEREYRSMATRGMAVQRYRTLASSFQDTMVVRHAAPKIAARTEGCSEYCFTAADVKAGGTFGKGDRPGIGPCWISGADSEFTRGNENFVEVEFGAMEGEAYRCWIQVGACCSETFQAFFQVSDLVVAHPAKPKQTAFAGPGSLFAVAAALPVGPGPSTHAGHGGPKEPTRWGWIEIPSQKFAVPGAKRLRLLTAQKGFAVARVIVSSTRTARPADSELAKLEAGRETLDLPPLPADSGLAGAWTFDETAEDLSGNGLDARLPLTSSWEAGKAGRAILLRGEDGATVDDSPRLRLAGDLTISVWIKVAALPREKALLVGKGGTYRLWLLPEGRVVFEQADDADVGILRVSPFTVLETGRWIHLAAVVRGGHGSVYVAGRPEAAKVRSGMPGTSEAPLTIGEGFSGLMDELRIHSKALPSDEILRESQR